MSGIPEIIMNTEHESIKQESILCCRTLLNIFDSLFNLFFNLILFLLEIRELQTHFFPFCFTQIANPKNSDLHLRKLTILDFSLEISNLSLSFR